MEVVQEKKTLNRFTVNADARFIVYSFLFLECNKLHVVNKDNRAAYSI